ncbi:mercuric reductase [Daejeonella oryzae]|uniref:mercuric reductase n=1 Tax=Daejeonella oryzae TaxID=1122943 RepID=UPI000423CE41|nr:mercuric reductase [Daejeonella oryzae]
MRKYDAIIIGSGQAGTPLAKKLAEAGYKTALLEREFIGGTCINYGCTPTKTMIASARSAYLSKNSKYLGINTGSISVDFKKIVSRKDKIVRSFRENLETNLIKVKGLDILYGEASFITDKTLKLSSANKKDLLLTADKIFINAGSRPTIPAIKGIETINYLDSTSILDLKEIPEHLIIIGGSYIALEFGQMFRRFGSKITIVERSDQFLSGEDNDVAAELKIILEEEGLNILISSETKSLKKNENGSIIVTLNVKGKAKTIRGSHLLMAVGRTPNSESLNPEAAGLQTDEGRFFKVSNKLQTNIKGIFALGDIKGGPAFTHTSYNDHLVIIKNLLEEKDINIKNRMVPYCMFTDPQLGRIGLNEKQAISKKLKYKVALIKMDRVARAIETGDTRGLIKALVDTKTKQILGASVIGTEGGEIMTVLQMAMMGKVTYEEIRDGVFAHPTYSESLNNLFMTLDSK